VTHAQTMFAISERRACKILKQPRTTQRRKPLVRDDEERLTKRIVELAVKYGGYGYRLITGKLRLEGWIVNHKRVERIWRQEGLKVPKRQPKRSRLWHNDGSCYRLRPEHKNHVWSYDFIFDRTRDGKVIKILTVIDEFSRECLALKVERKLKSEDVIDALNELFLERGVPQHIRSDNGSEFIAEELRDWLKTLNVKPLYILPGSPWENGFVESFHSRFRAELLSRELFDTLWEAQVVIKDWRHDYNTVRPHSALGYKPPAPEAVDVSEGHAKDSLSKDVVETYCKSSAATPLQTCNKEDLVVY
jgi:putative transposase